MAMSRGRGTDGIETGWRKPVVPAVGFPDVIAPMGAFSHVRVTGGPLAARASVAEGARGLLLSRRAGEDGTDYFEVSILFSNDRTATPILIAADDHDVVARWRGHAAELGLPLMMEREDGVILTAYEHLGRVILGPVRLRRRNPATMKRRPRFLVRRKTGRSLPVAS